MGTGDGEGGELTKSVQQTARERRRERAINRSEQSLSSIRPGLEAIMDCCWLCTEKAEGKKQREPAKFSSPGPAA
jgi:hypothetical protein